MKERKKQRGRNKERKRKKEKETNKQRGRKREKERNRKKEGKRKKERSQLYWRPLAVVPDQRGMLAANISCNSTKNLCDLLL